MRLRPHQITLFFTILCFTLTSTVSFSQETAQPVTGTVSGIVRDTVHNYVLKAATVAIYKSDSTVLNYQLSNNYGEFKFTKLPIGQPLRIDISNVGYELVRKNIVIPKGQTSLDLKTLIINPRVETLREVVITIPPITYNNDTLEINAAAFKLDTNATVEDLLKKIPNITVWGDGVITVNGQKVKNLLVNGKKFFGSDNKIALQNIPKNALEKIQIFNEANRTSGNLLDSNLVANLKLKKGKDRSYFGKIGLGYGTDNRYQFDGNLNFKTPKLELALIGASNNVNKTPNDIDELMRNSTYKGVGTSVEYQSDFRQAGINKGNVAGAKMSYNFTPVKDYWEDNSRLSTDYLFKNLQSINNSTDQNTTTIGPNNEIFSNSNNASVINSNSHALNSSYNFNNKSHRLDLRQNFSTAIVDNTSGDTRFARNNSGALTSTNNSNSQSASNNKNFGFSADYTYNNYNDWKKRFKNLTANYTVNISDSNVDRTEITTFRDLTNQGNDQNFNRKYLESTNNLSQTMQVRLPDIKSLLFGTAQLANFDAELGSKLSLNHNKNQRFAQDYSVQTESYIRNDYLTNNLQDNSLIYTPSFSLSKSFSKNLSNRYNKSLRFNLSAAQQLTRQENTSNKSFQNINRSYSNFVPSGNVDAFNYQYGDYQEQLSVNYNTQINIPTINQLAPLTDSTNLYNLQRGNINLREATDRSLALSFYYTDLKDKNPLNFDFSASIGSIANDIVDSTFVDEKNIRNIFLTNASGTKYANFNGNIRKSHKFKNSELQLFFNSRVTIKKSPTYFNNVFNFSNNFYTYNKVAAIYSFKNKFGVEASQEINTNVSKQEALNTEYKNLGFVSVISTNYNFTKKFTVSSNIIFNSDNPSIGKTINFTIWNADAIYRFTKGKNAEVKLSALDILHQNRAVFNYAGVNSLSTSTKNVLQQYFMITLSYYPRKFGKSEK